jgi:hypothetical protein
MLLCRQREELWSRSRETKEFPGCFLKNAIATYYIYPFSLKKAHAKSTFCFILGLCLERNLHDANFDVHKEYLCA